MNKIGFLAKEDYYSTVSEDVEGFLTKRFEEQGDDNESVEHHVLITKRFEEQGDDNESVEHHVLMKRTSSSFTKGWEGSLLRLISELTEEESERSRQNLQEILREKIQSTKTHDEVLDILSDHDLGHYVCDYHDYLAWRQENLEEDESLGIVLQSLQSWAFFLINFAEPNNLPYAKITADDVGCIDLMWEISPSPIPFDLDNEYYGNGEGIAMLKFYPSYLNHLTILSGAYGCERLRISLDGTLSYTKTQEILITFGDRLLYAES